MERNIFILIIFSVFFAFMLTACKPAMIERPDKAFQSANRWLGENSGSITSGLAGQKVDAEQAFRQGYVIIYSEGLPKPDIETAGQRRLTAIRAAEVKAQRDLAVFLSQGSRYQSVRFDNYSSSLQQALRGFQYVSKDYSDELRKAAVLLKYDLRGAKGFIR